MTWSVSQAVRELRDCTTDSVDSVTHLGYICKAQVGLSESAPVYPFYTSCESDITLIYPIPVQRWGTEWYMRLKK